MTNARRERRTPFTRSRSITKPKAAHQSPKPCGDESPMRLDAACKGTGTDDQQEEEATQRRKKKKKRNTGGLTTDMAP